MARLDELEALLAAATSDASRWNGAYVAALDALPDLIAVARAAEAYVALHDTMNYPQTAAMYPAALRAALDRLNDEGKVKLQEKANDNS